MKNYAAMMVLVLVCCGCDSGTKYHFENYSEAKSDKTVIGASLPGFVPASARDIDGWYHIETNEQTLEFTLAEPDKATMIISFSPVQNLKSICTRESLMSRGWSDVRQGDRFEFYFKTDEKLTECLGINIDRQRVYYWSFPAESQ
jgi:hypothetical protein